MSSCLNQVLKHNPLNIPITSPVAVALVRLRLSSDVQRCSVHCLPRVALVVAPHALAGTCAVVVVIVWESKHDTFINTSE